MAGFQKTELMPPHKCPQPCLAPLYPRKLFYFYYGFGYAAGRAGHEQFLNTSCLTLKDAGICPIVYLGKAVNAFVAINGDPITDAITVGINNIPYLFIGKANAPLLYKPHEVFSAQ